MPLSSWSASWAVSASAPTCVGCSTAGSRRVVERRKPLRRDGPGARRFADKRSNLKRTGPPARNTARPRDESRAPGARKRASNAPRIPDKVRAVVRARSGGRCEARLEGCTRAAAEMHHRNRTRSDNRPVNLVHCCWHCHRVSIHGNVARSLAAGWLVSRYADVGPLPEPGT